MAIHTYIYILSEKNLKSRSATFLDRWPIIVLQYLLKPYFVSNKLQISTARIMTTLTPFADPNQRESEANSSAGGLTPSTSHHGAHTVTRSRRSSSIIQHLEPDTLDTKIDQALNPNVNANWVNFKGAWVIHIVLIIFLKVFFNFITVLDNDWKWTLTNLVYNIGSYIMFHQVKGTPFEFNSGAYDNLTLWEQIDNGDQYTPTKKFLMTVPIGLFLVSTHYSNYNLNLFVLNGVSCLCVVVPKLAISHRLRVTLY